MKRVICLIAALSCTFYMSTANAAQGWQPDAKIIKIAIAQDEAGFAITTDAGTTDCTQNGKYFFSWDSFRANEVYATALTALSSNRKIQIYADSSLGCPQSGIGSTSIVIKSAQ